MRPRPSDPCNSAAAEASAPPSRNNLVYQWSESLPGIAAYQLEVPVAYFALRPITLYTKSKYSYLFVGIRLNTSLLSPQTMLFPRPFLIYTALKSFFKKHLKTPKKRFTLFSKGV